MFATVMMKDGGNYNMGLEIKLAYEDNDKIKNLFLEYTKMLVENDVSFAEYLELQNYDAELEHLTDKYGLPKGRLFIAMLDNKVAGCIGLRYINDDCCEMKRLYVKPEYRGNKIANELVEQIIHSAKEIGYKYMVLDTLPFLTSAIHLYKRFGFYEIPAYNNSPVSNTVFMRLDLNK